MGADGEAYRSLQKLKRKDREDILATLVASEELETRSHRAGQDGQPHLVLPGAGAAMKGFTEVFTRGGEVFCDKKGRYNNALPTYTPNTSTLHRIDIPQFRRGKYLLGSDLGSRSGCVYGGEALKSVKRSLRPCNCVIFRAEHFTALEHFTAEAFAKGQKQAIPPPRPPPPPAAQAAANHHQAQKRQPHDAAHARRHHAWPSVTNGSRNRGY